MFERIKISLWDIITFFVTGIVLIVNISILFPNSITIAIANNFLKTILKEKFLALLFYIISIYTIGASFEPISNFLFRLLTRLYKKLPWNKNLIKLINEQEKHLKPKVKKIIQAKYKLKGIDYYNFAKDYLLQKNLTPLFMQFLSKFGLYRNLTIIVFIDIIILLLRINSYSIKHFCLIILMVIIHFIFYNRARAFYLYVGHTVYHNYITAENN